MANLAIIPARSGSKGLKDKNIKPLLGKPMLAYTIEAAIGSGVCDRVFVSTDSKEYAAIAIEYGAEVPFLRNENIARDDSPTRAAILEAVDRYKDLGMVFDNVIILQPTSPLREALDIKEAYDLFLAKGAKSIISVCEVEHSPLWSNTLPSSLSMEGFVRDEYVDVRRQDLPAYYRLNGAIYIFNLQSYIDGEPDYSSDTYAFSMPKHRSIDVDNSIDFDFAELLMLKKPISKSDFIPLSVPNLRGNELRYVSDALKTEWVSTAGAYVESFERELSRYVGTEDAVSCQNGTSGLHIALLLCGVGYGDEVIAPSLTFIAAVNPIRYLGAEPVFMDCDESLCIDPAKVERFCIEECDFVDGKLINKRSKKHIKGIVVVHIFGNMADMERLVPLAKRFNLKLIEDATEALGTYYIGGEYKGYHAGTIGDIGVYSFNGNKIITTGGGGMIVSRDNDILKRARHLVTQAKSDELYYTHDMVGYNYRMTNLQAAVGLGQLERLEEFIEIKSQNYKRYRSYFNKIDDLQMINFRDGVRSNYWFYSLLLGEDLTVGRDELIKGLSKVGIQTRPVWGLIHQQVPYISNQSYNIDSAIVYGIKILNIPCSSSLSLEDVDKVCREIVALL